MLLAISTRPGIQSRSWLNDSGSSWAPLEAGQGGRLHVVPAAAHVAGPGTFRGDPLLGQHVEAPVEALQQVVVDDVRPVVAHPAQLARERVGRLACRAPAAAPRGPGRRSASAPLADCLRMAATMRG